MNTSYIYIRITLFTIFLTAVAISWAQDNSGGTLSGSLQAQGNFFQADSAIGAFGTPQYDRQLYSADTWLTLNYSNWGFDFGLRFDLFNNSNLLNPQDSYTDEGFGRWYIRKNIDKLDLTAGYIYDQIGSGLIFRAFEERPLLIDNALLGARLEYELTPDWRVKVLTGRQKQQFEVYEPVIKAFSIDGFWDTGEESIVSLAQGFGVVNRTYDDETMNQIVGTISTYTPTDSIAPQYNTYAFSFYNSLTAGPFNLYLEGAYKTRDIFFDPFAEKLNWDGKTSLGKLVNRSGTLIYSSLSYADKGWGITLEGKRTENFTFRTTPFVPLNQGLINFLPPMTRVNTYRLTARYNAATQELGEQAAQVDVRYSPNRKWSFNASGSYIDNLEGGLLYRELFTEVLFRYERKWTLQGGLQIQRYNQEIYEGKPEAPLVRTVIPYADFLYKISRRKSIRFETQYMATEQDFGSWLFGLVEFSIAPHWTFTVSDMYNIKPKITEEDIHYPRFDIFYNYGANRFSLSYIKQVEGVVCTGGICRLEPAFSGVQLTVNSLF